MYIAIIICKNIVKIRKDESAYCEETLAVNGLACVRGNCETGLLTGAKCNRADCISTVN